MMLAETLGETPGMAARFGEQMKTYNVDEVKRHIDWMKKLNKADLTKIKWVNDKGEEIKVEPEVVDEWNFTGLNNRDFVDAVFFGNFRHTVMLIGKEKKTK